MATRTREMPASQAHTRYEDDLYTWVQEQVALLRAGRLDDIDVLNIAEELSDVGISELKALRSRFAVLTQHLLKWDLQPKLRSRSWELSIREQRRQIVEALEESPGLKTKLANAVASGYAGGRNQALEETGLADAAMPEICPYSFEEMMTRPIVYEKPQRPRRKLR